jgi:outer membrane lipoprotein carrier protein
MAAVKSWFRTAIEGVCLAGLLLLAAIAPAAAGGSDPVGAGASADEAAAEAARAAYRAESRDRLARRLDQLSVYAARFTQDVFGARGEVLERAQGQVLLRRPDFKWVVEDPYPQVIVAEGDSLKVYDPDLEQLTIRPLDEALADTPVSLLTRDGVAIGDNFIVVRIADQQGETFVIEPTSEETLYREIRLHFDTLSLTGLDILDHMGQRTEIRFSADPEVTVIDSDQFELEIPPGTDVIRG